MNKAIADQKKQKDDAHMSTYHLEMPLVESNLIFRNFPPAVADGEIEDRATLKAAVKDVFATMKIGPRINVVDVARFKKKERGPEGGNWAERSDDKPGLVMVKLASPDMKKIVFSHIRNLRGSGYHKISINRQFPKCLVSQATELEKKARKIRLDSGNKTKTRIEPKDAQVLLKIKEENETQFKVIERL